MSQNSESVFLVFEVTALQLGFYIAPVSTRAIGGDFKRDQVVRHDGTGRLTTCAFSKPNQYENTDRTGGERNARYSIAASGQDPILTLEDLKYGAVTSVASPEIANFCVPYENPFLSV